MVDCSDLVFSQVVTSQEYDGYIDLIRERTAFNETILSECHAAICGALWGYGNTDLAGIGVSPPPNLDLINPRATCNPPNSHRVPGSRRLLPHHPP